MPRNRITATRLAATAAAVLIAFAPVPLDAQVLHGLILEEGTEEPVRQASVALMLDDSTEVARAVTGDDGSFVVRAPRAGAYFIVATALGYQHSVTASFDLQPPGRRIRVLVSPEPIALDSLVGEGTVIRPFSRNQQFYDRMKNRSGGRFITRTDIERRNPTFAHDMLRNVAGLRVAMVRGQALIEAAQPMSFQTTISGRRCLANLYIDGMPVSNEAINSITPADIEGFEIYTNTGAIPAEFNSSMGAACGVVVIWTRGGFEPR
jgi:hypothetical protein